MSNDKAKSTQDCENSSRRNFLNKLSTFVGVTSATSLIAGNGISVALAYTPQLDSTQRAGKLLTQSQLILLKAICEQVIPKTDTLGAAEVDTHGFIDNQLFHCHSAHQQQIIITLLKDIDKESKQLYKTTFINLSSALKISLLNQLEQSNKSLSKNYRGPFKQLKSLICFGYYTSEEGASKELRYLAFPGGYKGSIPYKKTDANWGSQGLGY
ncbi:gluconate 2-dehydrogenase subunit 3 family protein [Paraglaciecola sp.]|uniref:gluconate 2-dehydrogenase subunit 3 family protein n=1 Tax=Paraglaciecola sp. TaxID=1920173 RepID=UPI003EF7E321